MAYDVDQKPGSWVAEQAARRSALVWLLGTGLFAIALFAFVLVVSDRATFATSVIVIIAAVGLGWVANRRSDDAIRWIKGANAEKAVGDELDRLKPEYVVLHDIRQLGEGNIDHFVGGATGAFMVETKWRWFDDDDLRKARRQAAKIHDELGVWVTPVICLATRDQDPFNQDRVCIVPRARINDWIRAQQNAPVDVERVARWIAAL
jgi:hypothetical protein